MKRKCIVVLCFVLLQAQAEVQAALAAAMQSLQLPLLPAPRAQCSREHCWGLGCAAWPECALILLTKGAHLEQGKTKQPFVKRKQLAQLIKC